MQRSSPLMALVFASGLCLLLHSCVAGNFVDNLHQDVEIGRIRAWVVASEYRRLSATERGAEMLSGGGETIGFELQEVNSLDRRTKGARIDSWLVPSGADWMMLREMTARSSEEVLESEGLKLVRHGTTESDRSRLTFRNTPEGRYDLIVRARLRGNQLHQFVLAHGIMQVSGASGVVSDLRVIFPYELDATLAEIGATEIIE